jgi:hypothetical protein
MKRIVAVLFMSVMLNGCAALHATENKFLYGTNLAPRPFESYGGWGGTVIGTHRHQTVAQQQTGSSRDLP